jgi:thiol-disulfide isomerase/thioredoxin
MRSRRSVLSLVGLLPVALTVPAQAFEFAPYRTAEVEKAIASGKPVVVHVYAPWCVQCHAQASILESLKSDPTYDGVAFFRVDFDNQKDVVEKLKCPRSTLIAYKDGKEVKRMSWGTDRSSVVGVLKAAM